MGTHDGRTGGQRADTAVGDAVGIAPFHHGAADLEGLEALLHGAERHFGGELGGLLDGGAAGGLLLVGLLGQPEGVHNLVEGGGVLVHEVQQFVLQGLALDGHVAEFLPLVVVGGFATGEVGHHGAEAGGQGAHVGADAAAAGSGALAGGLVAEAAAGEVDKLLLRVVLNEELDDFLLGVEGLEVVETHALDGHLHDFLLADAEGALLFGQVVLAGVNEHALGDEAHDFASGDTQAAVLGATAHLVEALVHGGHLDGGDVHGDLGNAVVLDVPADGLGAFQGAGDHDGLAVLVLDGLAAGLATLAHGTALLAHVEGDGVGAAGGGGVEVVVDGHEEVAGTHLGGAGAGGVVVPGVGTEVGLPLLGAKARAEALVLAGAAVGQVAALGDEGGVLVAIDGDLQLFAEALAQLVGVLDNLVHRDVAHRDEGAHIGGTLARVGTVMLRHVDKLGGFLHHLVGGLEHGLRLTDEGDDGTVGGLAGVHIEKLHTLDLFNLGSDLIDDIHVAALADIGHTFNKLFHNCIKFYFCKCTKNI